MSKKTLRLSVVQMTSAATVGENVQVARKFLSEARAQGSDLVAFPECANLIQRDPEIAKREIYTESEDPFIQMCAERATDGPWVHLGSAAVRDPGAERFSNRSILIDDTGDIVARYDKIHLFDVQLGPGMEHRESKRYIPGDRAVISPTPWGDVGMTVCYDLRFPHLYRELAKAGAGILFAPSAFTVTTGRAHWETLVRCRAIENGAFMVAVAQCGSHADGRTTYGHSLVIDPWGEILVEGGEEPGLHHIDLDLQKITEARNKIPSLVNERFYEKI